MTDRSCDYCGAAPSGETNGCTCCPEWVCGTRYACPDCGPLNGSVYRSEECRRREIMFGNGDPSKLSGIGDVVKPIGQGVSVTLDRDAGVTRCPFCREVLCRCFT